MRKQNPRLFSVCRFPLLGGFKTAKQRQSQTSQQRTPSQNSSPVPFAQLHLARLETCNWLHLPLSHLQFTALASNKADKGSVCQQKARMNNLNHTKGSIQITLLKHAILVSIIYYLQHLEHVLLLKVKTQIPGSHTPKRNIFFCYKILKYQMSITRMYLELIYISFL